MSQVTIDGKEVDVRLLEKLNETIKKSSTHSAKLLWIAIGIAIISLAVSISVAIWK